MNSDPQNMIDVSSSQSTSLRGQRTFPMDDFGLEFVELKSGEVLFQQGDDGDCFYMLKSGTLGVRLRHDDGTESEIDRLAPGALVGEMAFLSGQKRSATVYALSDAGLLRINGSITQDTTKAQTSEAKVSDVQAASINQSFDTHWQRIQLSRIFNNLLGELDVVTLHTLQEEVNWLHLSNGDVIFRQNDLSDGMYVLVNGRLRVTVLTREGQERVVTEIAPGETFGEFALLTNEPRSATISATRESNVIHIPTATFTKLKKLNPQFMTKITQIIITRRQRTLARQNVKQLTPYSITLLPATVGVDLVTFAQQLETALSEYVPVTKLDAQTFDLLYGRAGVAQTKPGDALHSAVVAWLNEFEMDKTFIIYTADTTSTAWTHRCLNHADRILLIADAQGDPQPNEIENILSQMEIPLRTELVLWHPPQTERPSGTAQWLDCRQLHTHHHIRQGDANHMSRLARWLTGNSIALVLSGGGARGFAHTGVHRVLEELNIPIDYIGGTSMGAVMAAFMITYNSNAEIMDIIERLANPKSLFDRTLPFTSLMSSRKVTQLTQQLFGDICIEDHWTPFFCITTNLTKAQPMAMQRGPVWRAVRASLSIPGVFAPVIQNGETIVDGGVIDNFPARLMAEMCESEHIIGINVTPFRERTRDYDYETDISGWRILLSRLNPFTRSLRAPSLVGTILRTLDINSRQRAKEDESYTDLMIYPEAKGIGLLDFHKFEEIIQVGYNTALEPLQKWKDSRL